KALQLAQRLGARFLDYALHRPGWVQAWRRGANAGEAEEDRWQGRLFRVVDAELGRAGWLCPADLPGLAPRLSWPEGALLVSLNTLAPVYLDLLRALGERRGLGFFVLNPCADFWADHATRKAFLEGGEPPEGHPALGLWGRPGRDFVARLYDLTEGQDEARYEEPGRGTLLRALQSDLLAMQPPQAHSGPDRSLKVLAAPDPRREAEVVAGEIWRLLEDPPGGAPLTFADLAIVIPAAESAAYLEHLRAAFEATGGLPLSFEAATAGPKALLAEACGLLLDLLGSDASRAAVLRLLRHPASRARHPELDLEAAVALCERTGILRGLEDGDFAGTYLAGLDRLHWGQGLARAALAAFLPDGASPVGRDLPAAPVDRDAALALAALAADLRRWREGAARRAPQAWAEAFLALAARHLGDGSEPWVRARTALRERLEALAAWSPEGLPAPELAFAEARELLRSRLAGLDGAPEGGGIRVSTAMPMRAVPFRAVFVMGLTGGLFPAVDRVDPLDLRQRPGRSLPSDLGRAEQDRYLFLELLLSARDVLRLSHPALDPVTGDPLPRSSVLEELLEILQAMGVDPAALTEVHPLRRFDPAAFAPGSSLRSLAPAAAAEVRALVEGIAPGAPPLPEAPKASTELRITLAQLHAWLVEPAEGFAQIRLGLRREEDDPAARDAELLAPEALEASGLERGALLAVWRDEPPEAALDRAWRELELRGRAPLGPAATAAKTASLARVKAWAEALGPGAWRVHRFGGAPASPAELPQAPLRFELELGGRRQAVTLEGTTRFVAADRLAEVTRSAALSKAQALERHLRLRVDQLALAAAGLPAPAQLLVASPSGKPKVLHLPPPEPGAARAQLEAWLAALLAEGVPRRLPAAYALEPRDVEPALWIAAQERRREPWTVLPGSQLRSLPAPDRAAALPELAFRLGPLAALSGDADAGADPGIAAGEDA
ncbi:MAG TPA: exodeoxyribonuclease V subunit gamma, partial [Holophagaceae bacterium]|nr:exodeoxyribonuclease V subunit gamma [Holophagaceae bacterium]